MTGPRGNSEFYFPSNLNVTLCFAWGNIEGLTETNHTISLGVSQCHWLEQIHTKLLATLDSQKKTFSTANSLQCKLWHWCFCLKKFTKTLAIQYGFLCVQIRQLQWQALSKVSFNIRKDVCF